MPALTMDCSASCHGYSGRRVHGEAVALEVRHHPRIGRRRRLGGHIQQRSGGASDHLHVGGTDLLACLLRTIDGLIHRHRVGQHVSERGWYQSTA